MPELIRGDVTRLARRLPRWSRKEDSEHDREADPFTEPVTLLNYMASAIPVLSVRDLPEHHYYRLQAQGGDWVCLSCTGHGSIGDRGLVLHDASCPVGTLFDLWHEVREGRARMTVEWVPEDV